MSVKENGMSVKKASREFGIPTQTLRDRVIGKINIDTVVVGKAPLFTLDEEARMANHFQEMAKYGYGYTCKEVIDIATDFAIQLGKRTKQQILTDKWFRGYIKRWPELRVLRPRALEFVRATSASAENVNKYFKVLGDVLQKYDLTNSPHLIFNIDEKGITLNHSPPYVVSSTDHHPPAITSGRSSTITVIGGGSASGISIPPFFVFPGSRMRSELLNGGSPGTDGNVSETGWSNSDIFRQYLEHHFMKFAPGRQDKPIFIILDGHKTHVSVGLIEWAKSQNVILHILPAHTSHLLQPLDVACYGPFQRIYNAECHKRIRLMSSVITKQNVCEIACTAYSKALSSGNLQSAFRRTGIYPLNPGVIHPDLLLPAEVHQQKPENESNTDQETTQVTAEMTNASDDKADSGDNAADFFQKRVEAVKTVKSEHTKKARNTLSKIVSGKVITADNVAHKVKMHIENSKCKPKSTVSQKKTKKSQNVTKQPKLITNKTIIPTSPQPGPSTINITEDSPDTDVLSDDDDIITEEEKCCRCKQWTPEALRLSTAFAMVKWVQCDRCAHWVHLGHCTETRVIRRGDEFHCIHCQ